MPRIGVTAVRYGFAIRIELGGGNTAVNGDCVGIERIRTDGRKLCSARIGYITCRAGLFHVCCRNARNIVRRHKFYITCVGVCSALDRVRSRIQRTCGLGLIQRYRVIRRTVAAFILCIERVRAFGSELASARIGRIVGIPRHFDIGVRDPRNAVSCREFNVIGV